MSEIFDGVGEEVTLGLLDVEAVLPQAFEDLSKMLLMLSWIFRVNQDIIQIKNDTNVQHISEDLIHESLKCCWGIGQSKWHDIELVMTITRSEHCFMSVPWIDCNLVVAAGEIQLAEDLCIMELIQEFINSWQSIAILDCLTVECMVVNTHS